MKNRLTLCVALALLAGCSGGGSSSSPAPKVPPAGGQKVNASFKITIPGSSASQARARRGQRNPMWVSPSSNGILANVYVAGSGDKTPIASAAVNVSASSSGCTTGTGGSRTCTVTVPAPVGSDDFIFTDYDKAPSQTGSFVGANELAQGTALNQTIAAGVANTIGVTLDGYVANFKLTPSAELSFDGGSTPQTQNLTITALDADGNTITSDPYLNPITVSVAFEPSGSAGHTHLSVNGGSPSTSVTDASPTDNVVVEYDGGGSASPPYYAKLSVSANGVNPQSLQVSPLFVTTSPKQLNFTQPGQTASLNMTQQPFPGASYGLTSTNCSQLNVVTWSQGSSAKVYSLTSGQSDSTPCVLVASDGVTMYNVQVNPTNAGGGQTVPIGDVPSPQPGINKIQHVVVIIQENRSFDNLFHGFPGADTATYGYDGQGNQIQLQGFPLTLAHGNNPGVSPGHLHDDWAYEYNNGAMNGWKQDAQLQNVEYQYVYSYILQSYVQLYWNIAQAYGIGDRFFSTSNGASFPQHQYLIAAQSDDAEDTPQQKGQSKLQAWGCDSPNPQPPATPNPTYVTVLDPSTGLSTSPYDPRNPFPCFNYPTLADELMDKGLDSNYYAVAITGNNSSGQPNFGQFNAFDAVSHISCVNNAQPCQRSAYWNNNVISPPQQVLSDIPNGKLGAFTWVDCDIYETCDHPLQVVQTSPEWPTSVIDAIGQSKFWDSTAIFLIWDDWGGFFDHVVPPQLDQLGLGMRTGIIVVSPYAKNGYVSHVQHEGGSILKFAEEAFGLKVLGATDSRADDLRDFFNFSQSPQKYKGPFGSSEARAPRYWNKYYVSQQQLMEP